MTRFNVKTMTVDELVEQFVAIAVYQEKAIFDGETAKFNRLYDQMEEVRKELKSRPGDQCQALLPLYAHANTQVRLRAALATLENEPGAARKVLEGIANSRRDPEAAADALAAIWKLNGRPLVRS
jgi:hypothetical protein